MPSKPPAKPKPKPPAQVPPFGVRLDDDLKARAQAAADERGQTLSQWIRWCMVQQLKVVSAEASRQ